MAEVGIKCSKCRKQRRLNISIVEVKHLKPVVCADGRLEIGRPEEA
jgi:hypothetical protein